MNFSFVFLVFFAFIYASPSFSKWDYSINLKGYVENPKNFKQSASVLFSKSLSDSKKFILDVGTRRSLVSKRHTFSSIGETGVQFIDLNQAYFHWEGKNSAFKLGRFSESLFRPMGSELVWDRDFSPLGVFYQYTLPFRGYYEASFSLSSFILTPHKNKIFNLGSYIKNDRKTSNIYHMNTEYSGKFLTSENSYIKFGLSHSFFPQAEFSLDFSSGDSYEDCERFDIFFNCEELSLFASGESDSFSFFRDERFCGSEHEGYTICATGETVQERYILGLSQFYILGSYGTQDEGRYALLFHMARNKHFNTNHMAWLGSFLLEKKNWRFQYKYIHQERYSVLGGLNDSNFCHGVLNCRGSSFAFSYQTGKKVKLSLRYDRGERIHTPKNFLKVPIQTFILSAGVKI